MNLDKTTKIEEEIVHLPVKELDERIANSKTETDKKFWLTLKNRGLQYQQLKVFNEIYYQKKDKIIFNETKGIKWAQKVIKAD